MRIVVIDDKQVHLTSALQTLAGHEVTVCATHKEADEFLYGNFDRVRWVDLEKQYIKEGLDLRQAAERAKNESVLPYWDVVLTDLPMPAGPMAQGGEGERFVGQVMAVGWSVALQAVKQGAKFVAVVTDMNHPHHPASAMLDAFNRHFFTMGGARALMTNYAPMVGIAGTECACGKCGGNGKSQQGEECWRCNGFGRDHKEKGKDWGKILSALLGSDKTYQG